MHATAGFSQRTSVLRAGSVPRLQNRARQVSVRFKKDDAPEKKAGGKPTTPEKKSAADHQVDSSLRNMKAADPAIARMVLKSWKDAGVTDAKGVRRALIRAGISTVGVLALQSGFEAVAAYCSFATARTVAIQEFPLHEAVAVVITFFGFYFLVGIVFDLFTIGATITSTALLGTKADVVFNTVEALATERSGLGIVDKAQQAVNTGKVVLALNSIATALKMKNEEGGKPSMQTLDRLGALMTLKDAEEKSGFSAAKYGISDGEALQIATQFSTFDANSDNRLEFSEFKRFCDASEFELNEAEAKVALSMLDANGDGYIEFDEFTQWWVKSNEERAADVEAKVAETKPEQSKATSKEQKA